MKVKHENHTPEQCDKCNKAFVTPHALQAHKYDMHKKSMWATFIQDILARMT